MAETRAVTKAEVAMVREKAKSLGLRVKKVHRRILMEEFDERYSKWLCMFCGEQETPDHHLQHKNEVILVIDCGEEQLPVMDDETDLLETRTIVDPKAEIREGLAHKAILEEKSTSQFQVPIANSEIVRSIEPGRVDLGLENEEYVVLNENLEQEWDQRNAKKKIDVDGDVERDQKMIRDTKTGCAHKVLVKMPSKEKRVKHLKAWKFKFKPTSKRSRLMDDKFSFVDATVLLNKDPQDIIWGCINKEFKETVADCGKTRVDRFKHLKGWKFKFKRKSLVGIMLQIELSKRRRIMYNKLSTNIKDESMKVMIPGNYLRMLRQLHKSRVQCKMRMLNDSWSMRQPTLKIMKSHRKHKWKSKHLQIASNFWINHSHKLADLVLRTALTDWRTKNLKGLAYDGCVSLEINFAGFGRGKTEMLATRQKMQKIDLFSFGTHTEMEGNVELKQLLVAMERFSQEVIEQKIEGGLSCGDVKFHLKHKWRFRLLESFSRLVLLAWINLWFSKACEFSGQLQDSSKGEAESFPFLDFAAGQHLLWMQNNSEPIFIVSELERKKKLCYKTWMFKYKADEEDQGILQSRTGWVQEVSDVICFLRRRHLHLHLDCEEPELAGRKRNHGLFIRVHNKLKQQRCPKSWMFKFKTDSKSARTNYILLQEKKPNEFEQVMNHSPFSVAKFGKYKDCDALLLLLPSDERFQIKHSELLVIVLEWVDTKGGFGMDKKPLHLSLRNRVWDPGG